MNTTELIDAVSERAVLTKAQAKTTIEALFAVITDELMAGNDVRITDFGTFRYAERKAGMGRNPVTGEKVNVARKRKVRLKMGKALTDSMNPVTRQARQTTQQRAS
jgi:DNA-binding protein HU-beta